MDKNAGHMKLVYNRKAIASKIVMCDSSFKRAMGVMFREKPIEKDEAYFFSMDWEGRWGIHMFFVNFPIDVVWLDKDFRIADIAAGIQPSSVFNPGTWKVHYPGKKAKYAVELRSGSAKKHKMRIGGKLSLE